MFIFPELREVGLELRYGCVDVPLRVIVGTEGEVVDLVLVLLAEPYSELRLYPLSLLLLQLELLQLDDHLGEGGSTFGISPLRNSSSDLSRADPKTGSALDVFAKPRYLMLDI